MGSHGVVPHVGIRTGSEQCFGGLSMPMHCCLVQRGSTGVVPGVYIRAGSEQHLYDFSVSCMSCPMQGGFAMGCDCIDLGTGSQ